MNILSLRPIKGTFQFQKFYSYISLKLFNNLPDIIKRQTECFFKENLKIANGHVRG